jgi:membrane protein DedA with SNARE-associated domain
MTELRDIPRLVSEFVEMARAYLVQETVGAARKLGRFTGFSIGAGLLWAIAMLLLSVAGMRALVDVLPDSPYWEALGYLIFAVALVLFALVLVRIVPTTTVKPPSEEDRP